MNFEISKNFYYKHIDQGESIFNKRYFVNLIKHSDRKIELFYPLGIIQAFKYFEFIDELNLGNIDLMINSILIEISDNNEIERVINLPGLHEKFTIIFKKLLELFEEKNIDFVKTKFSYLLQKGARIQNLLWPDIDFLLEDYLVKFEDDSYVDFDINSENEEIISSFIDICQNYKNDNEDYIIEYFEAKNNFLEKRNNFVEMKSSFLNDNLNFDQLRSINFKHRKYLYDNSNNSLKSAILYRKLDSGPTKILDVIKIKTV